MHISFYNQNSAKNALLIQVNGVKFYFSYSTIVWVFIPYSENAKYSGTYTMKNYWKWTTGKHLNWIDRGDHKNRLDRDEFEKVVKFAQKRAKIRDFPTIDI